MPTVPVETNRIGLASVTDAKLQPGDYRGSGLQALGAGLGSVGEGGAKLAQVLDRPPPKVPAKQTPKADIPGDGEPAPATPPPPPEAVADDATVKSRWNYFAEGSRAILRDGPGAFYAQNGFAARDTLPEATAALIALRDQARADLNDDQRAIFDRAIGPRFVIDMAGARAHAERETGVEQDRQSARLQANAAQDAIDHADDPVLFDTYVATGLDSIATQARLRGVDPDSPAVRQAATGYRSGILAGVTEAMLARDPLRAADYFDTHGGEMTDPDRRRIADTLVAPLLARQAIADLDTHAAERSPTAPATPPDMAVADLAATMRIITPPGPGTEDALPALLRRYGGDAARAWAASRIGAEAVDAAIATRGDDWFGAIPAGARRAVAEDMALLGAPASPRTAPSPEEHDASLRWIDDQPWPAARKQAARDELATRIGLAARHRKQAEAAATDAGFAAIDRLGADFLSIAQLPPAVRRDLPEEAQASFARIAAANADPQPVPANGGTALALNTLAARDPEGFAAKDLRLERDRMTPGEYATLTALQESLKSGRPGAEALTQGRVMGAIGSRAR